MDASGKSDARRDSADLIGAILALSLAPHYMFGEHIAGSWGRFGLATKRSANYITSRQD